MNASWDEKVGMVLSAEASSEQLDKLAKQAPKTDFYLLAADQRTSTRFLENPEQIGAAPVRRHSGECRAASER